jgi:hypothetical protein
VAEVADLFASLGLKFDEAAWNKADARLAAAKKAMDVLSRAGHPVGMNTSKAMGVVGLNVDKARKKMRELGDETAKAGKRAGDSWSSAGMALRGYLGYLGGRAAYSALVGFNSTVEDTKLQIAGMLALSKKTDLVDQLKVADKLYESLQKRAAVLPGETAEYVAMAGKLARVITDSGGSMKQLEDLTTNAVIAAKGLGENWEVAARDIEQALMGRYNTTDPFLKKVLPSIGYAGEKGQEKWRGLSKEKRFSEMSRALMQKQITQLGEAQGKTFSGRMSTLMDTVKQTLGGVGKELFGKLAETLKVVNEWLEKNRNTIKEVASALGGTLLIGLDMVKNAFDILVEGVKFFIEHSGLATVALVTLGVVLTVFAIKAAAAWLMALGPIGILIAAVVGVIAIIGILRKHWDKISAAFKSAGRAIAGVFGWLADRIKDIVSRVAEFFTDDIPNAIKAAFEWLEDLPVIGRLIKLVAELREFGGFKESKGLTRDKNGNWLPSATAPTLPTRSSPPGVSIGTVTVGDLNVQSSSADPKQVALEVKRVFHDEFSGVLRETMDVV